jgi:hypothetical protein
MANLSDRRDESYLVVKDRQINRINNKNLIEKAGLTFRDEYVLFVSGLAAQ